MTMYKKVDNWFDIVELEKKILAFWKKHGTFDKRVEKNKNGKIWSFLDGPITANNPMGVHHAWGRTLKDAYQRYYAMNGRKLRYQNGYDCQGLWVEVEVEKELNFNTKKDIEDYGIDKFVQRCKERVTKYSEVITRQSERLAFWMDWDNNYYTMSDENNYTIWTFLKKAHERELIYKGHDVMPWCPRCGTGISQHEMQEGYKDVKHMSLIVRFPLRERNNEALLVWTTTPWTLTSNVAVAVHPDCKYLKVKQGDWIYYLIKARAENVLNNKGTWKTIQELTGKDLIDAGFTYTGPYDELLAQEESKNHHHVIGWDEVSEEEGTGIVHIAPGCGAEDFELSKTFKLPAVAPLDENGIFIDGFDWLTGKHASGSADEIKQDLNNKKILYSSAKYSHAYPHCWRCSEELLFRLVDEWYIAIDSWREEIKTAARQIRWIPSFGLELELDWLNNMRDWMISKKRYWGLALPIWECPHCKSFEVIGSREELKEKAAAGWEKFAAHSPHRPWIDEVKIKCPGCGQMISRIPDVGNPWLDAGIVPYSTVKYNTDREYWKQWIPADLVLECFPGQFRNWFYSMLAMSTMMENIPPFKTLVGHALVRDENGEEMHKSRGNAIWFDDAADTIGVEVMRWIFCTHEMTTNLNFGYKSARLIRGKFFNTLWNSYAFFVNYARLMDFKAPETFSDLTRRPDFDRWILSELQVLIDKCRKSFEDYNIRTAARAVEEFLEILSNWYIRNNRRRFWRSELDEDTTFAYETLYEVLYTVIRLLAPVLPMLCEEMYQNMIRAADPGQPESIHLTDYPETKKDYIDKQLDEDMDNIIKINTVALSAREKSKIKTRQPLAKLIISPDNPLEVRALTRFADLIKTELNVKEIEILAVKTPCPTELRVRPSKKSLGRKYKSIGSLIAEKIEAKIDSIKAELETNPDHWKLEINVAGEDFLITRTDLLVEETEPGNLSVVRFNEGWVAFDTLLTEELLLEGFMRDFLRQMQVLRKDIGLEIEDRIHITYKTGSARAIKMMENYKDFICSELLCLQLKADPSLVPLSPGHVLKIYGEEIHVTIQKAARDT
jgi:isoleucyl-tRNA synthetase